MVQWQSSQFLHKPRRRHIHRQIFMVDSGLLGRGIVSVCIHYVGEKVYFADVTLLEVDYFTL